MEASTFSKPIKKIFNDINTIIVLILMFILVIKIEIRIDIRNNMVEIGLGILTILLILNNRYDIIKLYAGYVFVI